MGGGEWVYGDLLHDKDGRPHIVPRNQEYDFDDDMFEIYEVEPGSVGRFSGVFDSSGQEVFEGDIIRHGEELFDIRFGDGCFWRHGNDDTMELHTILGVGSFRVFSNVHDAPEVMEKQVVDTCKICGCERVFVPSSLTDESHLAGSGKSDLFECCECRWVQMII